MVLNHGLGFFPLKLKIHKETSRYINAKEIPEEQKDSIEPSRPSVFSHLGTHSTQISVFDHWAFNYLEGQCLNEYGQKPMKLL